ncbi:hypothetical protein [Aurantiacibacter aquimixticola]|uniref:Uncharacterized protein n=1 Tax=Aurantiacibacter aquimixticola TaxID=1958945 RepID=A0A419RRE9_9SPHN|nr:hypothetical protein [Aurantiacibacter aquimixticola]RJY08334.1 hypothetical protein D6201_02245 [Aurantiacibacter aquimixticola]
MFSIGPSDLARSLGDPYAKVSYGQQGEDLVLDRISRVMLGMDPAETRGPYLDIGAYHPKAHSTTALL